MPVRAEIELKSGPAKTAELACLEGVEQSVTVIRKKICMVGAFATGKTSLVRQFVYAKFSERYHSTIGVKVDRKEIAVKGSTVSLLLWDLEGRREHQDVPVSYLKGSSGLFFVADGTRRNTLDQIFDLQARATRAIGNVPSVVAINKRDLTEGWELDEKDYHALEGSGWHSLFTSAKTGDGVEEAFLWLAGATLETDR